MLHRIETNMRAQGVFADLSAAEYTIQRLADEQSGINPVWSSMRHLPELVGSTFLFPFNRYSKVLFSSIEQKVAACNALANRIAERTSQLSEITGIIPAVQAFDNLHIAYMTLLRANAEMSVVDRMQTGEGRLAAYLEGYTQVFGQQRAIFQTGVQAIASRIADMTKTEEAQTSAAAA